jgi:hypothetical protein
MFIASLCTLRSLFSWMFVLLDLCTAAGSFPGCSVCFWDLMHAARLSFAYMQSTSVHDKTAFPGNAGALGMCTTKQPFSGKCRSIYMPRKAIITKEMS